MAGNRPSGKIQLCTYTIRLTENLYVHTIYSVEFEWDPAKARENFRIHGVRFALARDVFEDEDALPPEEDLDFEGEQRFRIIGMDGLGRILVVVYTYRGENIRLISAWKASKRQEKQYAQGR